VQTRRTPSLHDVHRPDGPSRPGAARGFQLKGLQGVTGDEPALFEISRAAVEMMAAGVEMDDAATAIAVKLGRARHAEMLQREFPLPPPPPKPGVVYYIRRGNLIKIGTTVELRSRMQALLPNEVLATEPGDAKLEKKRHQQFSSTKVPGQREWFEPSDALTTHIAAVRAEHGEPDPTLPTLQAQENR